jgi:CHASE1-domain containing sensor protein
MYRGFVGDEVNNVTGKYTLEPRGERPFYFPAQLGEPLTKENLGLIGVDLYMPNSPRKNVQNIINLALRNYTDALSGRLTLFTESDTVPSHKVLFIHPGIQVFSVDPNMHATTYQL